jgi:hypothetical protein
MSSSRSTVFRRACCDRLCFLATPALGSAFALSRNAMYSSSVAIFAAGFAGPGSAGVDALVL